MHEYGVFIGRLEPVHQEHLRSMRFVLDRAQHLIVVLGSCNRSRSVKNPWSAGERSEMLLRALTQDEWKRTTVVRANDYLYNDNMWVANVQARLGEIIGESDDVALFGHKKDSSSFYLDLFPQWERIETGSSSKINATEIREKYFTLDNAYKEFLDPGVIDYLEQFKTTEKFKLLYDEYHYLKDYHAAWLGAPFPPTFNTVDSIVVKSGHVLVVRRRGKVGKGLIALPGGFLNSNERIKAAALRELREETGIKVPEDELGKKIVGSEVFDHPDRSLRGRTVTHAFYINLGWGDLPRVKGMDDADKAWWMPMNEVHQRAAEFFEDHYDIINHFIARS